MKNTDDKTEIQDEKINRIIKAGIASKKKDPESDLTPLSYQRIEGYIIDCENTIMRLGGKLPRVIY